MLDPVKRTLSSEVKRMEAWLDGFHFLRQSGAALWELFLEAIAGAVVHTATSPTYEKQATETHLAVVPELLCTAPWTAETKKRCPEGEMNSSFVLWAFYSFHL